MSDRFFKRKAIATVFQSGKEAAAKKIQVRMRFKCEKLSAGYLNPSKASLDLFNLNDDSRNLLAQRDVFVRLDAGYEDYTQVLFLMSVFKVKTVRQGADRISTVELLDGSVSLDRAHVEFNLAPGGTNQQAFKKAREVLRSAGVAEGLIEELTLEQYPNGWIYSGTISRLLDRLTRDIGFTWSVQDGQLSVTKKASKSKASIFLLTPQTGLIGSPSRDAMNGQGNYYTFKSMLNPRIKPNDVFQVQSEDVKNGFFRVWKVSHEGDTHEGDYLTTIEAEVNG